MGAKRNAIGHVSGRLTGLDNGFKKVLCLCVCGNQKLINRNHFLAGNVMSCGCLRVEKLVNMSTTHGLSDSRLYSIWQNMKTRCTNPNVDCYQHYGGKGISICNDWLTFEGFLQELPNGYAENLELDRKDSHGNYEPSNCRWVDRSVQCFNRETDYGGVTYCERDNLWRSKITKDGESYQKYFKLELDAINWRLQKEMELYGEYL